MYEQRVSQFLIYCLQTQSNTWLRQNQHKKSAYIYKAELVNNNIQKGFPSPYIFN